MLYISRRIFCSDEYEEWGFRSKYILGVVDTDDGVEQVVSGNELASCVHEFGIEVKGADAIAKTGDIFVLVADVPYQIPETLTKLQVKMLTLYGVRVSVYQNTISYISRDLSQNNSELNLRLSDFAPNVGDFVVDCALGLTFVFDDKLKAISEHAFFSHNGGYKMFAMFDLCEVTNEAIARAVYSCVEVRSVNIIDNPERKTRYRGYY